MIFGSVRSARKNDRRPATMIYDTDFLLSLKKDFTLPAAGARSLEHLRMRKEDLERLHDTGANGFSRDSMLTILPSSDNAWSSKKKCDNDDQAFIKEIRGVLNKITPQKYVEIICKTDLKRIYESDSRVNSVVEIIFDKALQEPAYAHLYVELSKDILSFASKPEKGLDFRRKIIQQAQHEFESSPGERCADEIIDEKSQKRQASNMKFIGELFLADLINTATVIHIISNLIRVGEDFIPSAWEIELLVTLLTLIGQQLESRDYTFVTEVFRRMRTLMKSPEYPPRIRFIMMDILESQAQKWKNRRLKPHVVM